jgi:lipopolysaccharide/colanic/teichoic acid biosynthesis glycosyltransferase
MKRALDVTVAATALLLLSPLLCFVALLVKADSPGPVLFRQERVGRHGQTFRIRKFRTMVVQAPQLGPMVTPSTDPRVTHVGRWLRKYKLDELPQLIDVLVGDMSLVGPRPEVPRYVAQYPPGVREKVLSIRPGMTDEASLEFIDEGELLAGATDPERVYVERVLPIKLRYYVDYVERPGLARDLGILARTAMRIVWR